MRLTSEEVLYSKAEAHFDASWGMMQSETTQSHSALLDLSSRLARAAAAHEGAMRSSAIHATVAQIEAMHASEAERQRLVDAAANAADPHSVVADQPQRGLRGLARFQSVEA